MKICILFLFSFSIIHAQQFHLEGQISDPAGEELSFVTIQLLKAQDSSFVKGTATDFHGKFIIEDVAPAAYIIKASFIGFEEIYHSFVLENGTNLGRLVLNPSTENLDEVAIFAKAPTVNRQIDRIIFNVANTTLSNGSTWDILKRTPSVIVQQNNIMVKNQAATVYINDKRVNLSPIEIQSLLENLSGMNIKSIEVITNPSAKYDAESGIIINIVTSKNLTPGYKGNISGNVEQAIFPKYRIGTGHYIKNDWLNLAVDYNINKRKEHKNDLGEITFFNPDNSVASFWDTDFERITRSETHTINTALDFFVSDKTTLNLSSIILLEPNTTYTNSEVAEIYNPQRALDSLFTTRSSLDLKKHNIAVDFGADHKFDDKGTILSVRMHYTNFDQERSQNVNTNYFLPNGDFLRNNSFSTEAGQQTNIWFTKMDFETILAGFKSETGIKFSQIDSESGIDFFDIENNDFTANTGLSDFFTYDESILAGYINIHKAWDKWELLAGVRGEQTDVEGNSITLSQVNISSYLDLIPNISLNFKPNPNHSITVAYKKSIARPRYDLLNPFSYFINENNYSTGNPNLVREITEKYSVNYIVEGVFSFELYYRHTQNPIEVLSFQNNPNRFLRNVSANMINRSGYGLEFLHGASMRPWWYFQTYFSLFHEENSFIAVESDNQQVTVAADGFFTSLYNGFTISEDKTLTADLILTHLTGLPLGTYLMDPFTTVSLGARKSLWNNRAVVSLTVNDIFDTTNRKLQTDYLNQRNSYFAIQETRYVQLGFVYNFGNFSLRDNTRQIRNEERDRIN